MEHKEMVKFEGIELELMLVRMRGDGMETGMSGAIMRMCGVM